MCPCFDRLHFANVGTRKREGLPSPGAAVWKRPPNEGILICKSVLVPFPVCGTEVNSAEERNRGKVPFLLGYRRGCAEEESVGCFFWVVLGSRQQVGWRGARQTHTGFPLRSLGSAGSVGEFPSWSKWPETGFDVSRPVCDVKGESRSEG